MAEGLRNPEGDKLQLPGLGSQQQGPELILTFTQLAFPDSFSAKAQPGRNPFHKHRPLSAARLCTGLAAPQPGPLVFPAVPGPVWPRVTCAL